jgi:molybdopterin synthase sulfur carrier subunit
MAKVQVRYWAAAKEAAGVEAEFVEADTVADALAAILASRAGGSSSRFPAVLDRSSLLVDGIRVGREAAPATILADQAVIEVLPPFAGG